MYCRASQPYPSEHHLSYNDRKTRPDVLEDGSGRLAGR